MIDDKSEPLLVPDGLLDKQRSWSVQSDMEEIKVQSRKATKVWQGTCAEESASCWLKMMFSWTKPIIEVCFVRFY